MSTDSRATIPGIVKNGVVVPQSKQSLAEGTHVEIIVEPTVVPAELKAEMDAWDGASDEAWAMIEKWEAEDQ
jgi:predicted DNA-binding antitoxin AbrB/MazE fold protein